MKTRELRGLSIEELLENKKKLSAELLNLRHQKVIRGLERPHRIKEIKRAVAAINTLLREKRQESPRRKE